MSDTFQLEAERLAQKGAAIIEEKKIEYSKAVEALQVAQKIYDECPKEDASENAPLQTAIENRARAHHKVWILDRELDALKESMTNYEPLGIVQLGTTVKLILTQINGVTPEGVPTDFILRLVEHDASNVQNGFMAVDSLVGKAIMGHVEGDDISITAPRGNLSYKLERVF